ncbi:MAG: hypothetical protein CM15mP120_30130 [Pseudomonadota bacterium]|nr:MAG: hypothetical protein CM15mP120_30130 [Pseudomonadota bacterium]
MGIARFLQLIVALHQHIPVCYFEGGMIELRLSTIDQKQSVMIDIICTAITACKRT